MDGEIINIASSEQVNETQVSGTTAQGVVKRILVIDMNFIMFPCIKLYFDSVNPDEHSTITWQSLEERKDIDQFLTIDKDAFLNIIKILRNNVNATVKFEPVEYQKDIIDKLVLDDDGIMYEIFNLDFYHDLFVDFKRDKQKLKHFNKYNDMNWIGYIDAKEKLFSYYWISCPNSPVLSPELKFNTERIQHISYYKLSEYLNYGFDEIYVSYSPNLVPHKYRFLTETIDELFKYYSAKETNKEG